MWDGNNDVFRTYVPGEGKEPDAKKIKKILGTSQFKGVAHIASFEEAEASGDFGGLLHEGLIDVSSDDARMSERFLAMIQANGWHCVAWMNPENGHLHTVWRNDLGRIRTKGGRDKRLAVGLIADLHAGDTYIPLRVNDVDRPPVYEHYPIQELPEELAQVSAQVKLWDCAEGGRNNALSSAARYLARNTVFGKNVIRRILTNTNDFMFAEPLPDSELQTILRDETFRDVIEFSPLDVKSAAQLSREDISPVEFIVQDLIPVGLTILASPPKYGKSFMCLDLSLAVAAGGEFLGFKTNKCGVLYLALEDRYDRLKQRMSAMIGDEAPPENFLFAIESATLGEGFIEQVELYLQNHPGTKLIIVDTFVKIRGEPKRNESAYKLDSREAGELKHFADRHGIAVLLVTHVRKFKDLGDPFANISGTYGIAGAADDMFVLSREKRVDAVTKFSITGRDVEENDFAIFRDPDSGRWTRRPESFDDFMMHQKIETARLEYMVGPLRKTLNRLLEENNGSWTGSCAAIITKSREYGTPIVLTSQQLGKQLSDVNSYLITDGVLHTEIKKGQGHAKLHKFEKHECK